MADLGPGRCIAVNAAGQILGVDDSGAGFVIDHSGARSSLGSSASVTAISPSGVALGYSTGDSRTAVAFQGGAWSPVAGVTGAWSAAIGADDQGRIVGVSGTATIGEMHAFLVAGGAAVALPLPAGNSAAYLTRNNRIAGVFETTGQTHGFVVSGNQLLDLGTLGGDTSAPYGMNASGDIAGVSGTANGFRHAFLVLAGGELVDLGVPDGAATSEARGVDDQGRVAGNAYDAIGVSRPLVFVHGQPPVDLLPAGASTSSYQGGYVAAVAPSGQIVGWGIPRDPSAGATHCLSWTPGGGQ